MSKYLIHRSKRLAFVKSTIRKCKSQLKLLEGNRVQPDKELTVQNEEHEIQEEGLESTYVMLKGQRIFYWRKPVLDVTDDEILDEFKECELEEEEAGEIFHDCNEEISSSKVLDGADRDDQADCTNSMADNHPKDSQNKNLHEGTEITIPEASVNEEMFFDGEEMHSDDEGEKEGNVKRGGEEVSEGVAEKWSCSLVKPVVLYLVFMAIGSYIIQILDMYDDGSMG